MRIRCPVCDCPIEVSDGEGGVVCSGCGEILGYAAGGGAFTAYTLPEDEDSYEFLAREYDKAVDEGDYARAESLRREMERMMGETNEEEEVEAIEDEDTEEVLIKDGYGEDWDDLEEDDEEFWDEEEDEEEF